MENIMTKLDELKIERIESTGVITPEIIREKNSLE